MAKKKNAEESTKIVERVQKLVSLAADGDTDEGTEEERTAAIKAVKLMAEHKLSVVPESEMQRAQKIIGEAKEIVQRIRAEGQNKMLLGAALGYFLGGR